MIHPVKSAAFYKKFASVWGMLALYQVITLGVNLMDNMMVASYSETALSGVTAVNQVQFLFQQLIMGAGDAAIVLGSQYWGQKKANPIKRFANGTILLGLCLSLILFVMACTVPEWMVGVFTPTESIRSEGVAYLKVIKHTYVPFALTGILLAALRSVSTVRIGFWVSLSTLLVNGALNYLLIEGRMGAPALGVAGAAIATLCARWIELLVVLLYLIFVDRKLHWRIRDLLYWDRVLVGDYLRLSRPFLLTSFLFGFSVLLQTVILGHMSDEAMAANAVASALYQCLKVVVVASSSAAAILIGNAVGETTVEGRACEGSDAKEAQMIPKAKMTKIRSYTQTLQVMFVGIGVCMSLLLFLLRGPVVALHDLSPETASLADRFLLILCITGLGTAYQMPTITGIIRGGGDARFAMVNDLISIWGVVIPLSFCASFVWKWSPVAVVFCLNSDQLFKCVAACIKVNRYRWMKKLTRDT